MQVTAVWAHKLHSEGAVKHPHTGVVCERQAKNNDTLYQALPESRDLPCHCPHPESHKAPLSAHCSLRGRSTGIKCLTRGSKLWE